MADKRMAIIKVNKCTKCETCMFEEYTKMDCKGGKLMFGVGQSTKRLHDLMNSCPGKLVLGFKTKEHRGNSCR